MTSNKRNLKENKRVFPQGQGKIRKAGEEAATRDVL